MFITTNANSLLLVQILNCKFDSKGKNIWLQELNHLKKNKNKNKNKTKRRC